ncbi:MAG: S8 family serine peptidase [Arhodomonas sp.]|nr:S8 family serine peptidase [Arhodomonas sp.]
MDDGIRPHEDLQGRILWEEGFDFVSSPLFSNDGDGIDPDPTDPALDGVTHGTSVAALVAAATDNALGVAGASWHAARILPVRVASAGGATLADAINGVRYAAGLSSAAGPEVAEPRANIVNISLGGPGGEAEAVEFEAVRARGVVVVSAAGNSGDATPSFPAAHASVLGVGATVRGGDRAAYSTIGESVSLTAPGSTPPAASSPRAATATTTPWRAPPSPHPRPRACSP